MISIDWDALLTNNALLGILVGVFAGMGRTIFTKIFSASQQQKNDATKLRNELRSDLTSANDHIEELQKELDEWRESYWTEHEAHANTKLQLAELKLRLSVSHINLPSGSVDTP